MQNRSEYHQFYHTDDPRRFGRTDLSEEATVTQRWLSLLESDTADIRVLELGCGMGELAHVCPNIIGLDFSLPALKRFRAPTPRVNGDMQSLPFVAESFHFVLSWAALEHVPEPERALLEMVRVLKPNGLLLLAPAWFCRPWASKGLPVRSYQDLNWPDRVRKALIPLRNNVFYRALCVLPKRLFRELVVCAKKKPYPFVYGTLQPNLHKYVYTDCDAFTSMDPHAAMVFFKTRHFDVLSHRTFLHRVAARHSPVVVKKHG